MDEIVGVDVSPGDESLIWGGRNNTGEGVPAKEILAIALGSDPEIVFRLWEVILWVNVDQYGEGNWIIRRGLIIEVVSVGDV